jgi:hypothetical protein
MAEVIPHTSIRLLFNVPLTSDYVNTYWFSNQQQQLIYFNQFSFYEVTDQSYQRKSRGWLRIMAPYNSVYNANYLMFKNISPTIDGDFPTVDYEEKWYFAFVDDVVYINERTAEVHYTIDVIQSYMWNWTFHDCFIERECTASDNLYEHILDEGIPLPDFEYSNHKSNDNLKDEVERMKFSTGLSDTPQHLSFDPHIVIATTLTEDYKDSTEISASDPPISHMYNGALVGCNMLVKTNGPITDTNSALYWITNLPGGKESAVLGIYMCPGIIANNPNRGEFYCNIPKPSNALGDYIPVNKKLLSSPYRSLVIQSSDGASQTFDLSKFYDSGNSILFYLDVFFTAPVQGALYPANYNHEAPMLPTIMPLPTLPSCTWSNDTYKAWVALNSGFAITSVAGSVIDAGARIGTAVGGAMLSGPLASAVGGSVLSNETALSLGGAIGNDPSTVGWIGETSGQAFARNARNISRGFGQQQGGLIGDIQNIANNYFAWQNAKLAPDTFNGSAQNLNSFVNGYYGFTWGIRHVRKEYARIIDKYFTMFGYKVNRVGKPSLHNRTRFTYIKTANCDIDGDIPNAERNLICEIFNKGVRFWAVENTVQFGDYTLSNDVIPGPTP